MKSACIGLAAFFAVSLMSEPAHAFRLEGEVGMVSGSYHSDNFSTGGGNTAVTFGAKLEFDLVELLSFEPGLQYVPKGFEPLGGASVTSYYLSAPLLLKARFPLPVLTPFVVAGPELGYKLGENDSLLSTVFPRKKLDFGLQFGGGFEFSLLPGITNYLRAVYSLGLVNVLDSSTNPNANLKTRAFLLTLGIVF